MYLFVPRVLSASCVPRHVAFVMHEKLRQSDKAYASPNTIGEQNPNWEIIFVIPSTCGEPPEAQSRRSILTGLHYGVSALNDRQILLLFLAYACARATTLQLRAKQRRFGKILTASR